MVPYNRQLPRPAIPEDVIIDRKQNLSQVLSCRHPLIPEVVNVENGGALVFKRVLPDNHLDNNL